MPLSDGAPSDSHLTASLEAIDATLAGDPVDPIHAELAELALLLADERPAIDPRFAGSLDDAVQRRFARPESGPSSPPARRRRWWLWTPAAGLVVALIAAVVIVAGGGSARPTFSSASSSLVAKAPSPAAGRSRGALAASSAAPTRSLALSAGPQRTSAVSTVFGPSPSAGVLQPPANGRKIIQGAELALNTAPSRIDQVAQELFVVVGQVQGIVRSSTVTATKGPGAYAQFQLSIPSASLPQAMASLSSLRYATVASRTDTTEDVNDQYQTDVRALADARALRTSLLKQLAGATTSAQIASLTAQIHDAEASISSDEATLRGLDRQIDYSQVAVTINGGPIPVPVPSRGFGLGQASHDAGRVLTVAAGIALIGLAVLAPVALLAALAWWVAAALRRRRREQALDLV